jgi:lipoprotein NlpI
VVPFAGEAGNNTVKVILDGRELNALIDTGASLSLLSHDVAKRLFGLEPGSPGLEEGGPITVLSGVQLKTYRAQFQSLDLGGVLFRNVPMAITQVPVADLVLGMHELRYMHLYVAYSEKKLYITEAPAEAVARDAVAVGDLIRLGMDRADKGDFAGAFLALDQAMRLDPGESSVYTARASVKSMQGDQVGALTDLTQAIAVEPKRAASYDYRGGAHARMGNYALAVADFTTAIGLQPKNAAHHFLRGVAHFVFGAFESAALDFEQVVALAPTDHYGVLWLHLARLKTGARDRLEFSRNAGKLAGKRWPQPLIALYQGEITAHDVRVAAGQGDLKTQRDRKCEAAFYIGEHMLASGDENSAIAALEEAVQGCPRDLIEYQSAAAELKRLSPQEPAQAPPAPPLTPPS